MLVQDKKMQMREHTCHPHKLSLFKLHRRPRAVHRRQGREQRHRHVTASANLVVFDPDVSSLVASRALVPSALWRAVQWPGYLALDTPTAMQDIVLETSLGTVGFMTVSSYTPDTDRGGLLMGGSSLDLDRIQQQGTQSLSSGGIKVRLYTG